MTATGRETDHKKDLHVYLQDARDVFLWKLEGLPEYDIRRPLTATGTNLLGLVKHVTGAEAFYFGEIFGRPVDAPALWIAGDAEPNADLWATADETREETIAHYRRVWAHSDATIDELDLDATGLLPGAERKELSLHRVLVHMVAETQRHAGHADVVRELIDGATGQRESGHHMAPGDSAWWQGHRARVEKVAREASGR
ncbi:DinB family protein [Streptomyces sp. NBC_01013]|uniref:DinB family protein n=1 Tax=Streptomyces sp. NBC_01013 TaxID=2903718 RepID=UPI00386EAF6C|nr:DinB family protein [Streptomyces sp. NBC_01013]